MGRKRGEVLFLFYFSVFELFLRVKRLIYPYILFMFFHLLNWDGIYEKLKLAKRNSLSS